jgi:hypothetical protein
MPDKEATARIKMNMLLEAASRRFFVAKKTDALDPRNDDSKPWYY